MNGTTTRLVASNGAMPSPEMASEIFIIGCPLMRTLVWSTERTSPMPNLPFCSRL